MDSIKTQITVIAQQRELLARYPAQTSKDELIVYYRGEVVYRETYPNDYTQKLARTICKHAPLSFSMIVSDDHYLADQIIEIPTADDTEWCTVDPKIGNETLLTITSWGQINEQLHYERIDAVRAALVRDGYTLTGETECEVEITIKRKC